MVDLKDDKPASKDHGQFDSSCSLLWMDVLYLLLIAVFQSQLSKAMSTMTQMQLFCGWNLTPKNKKSPTDIH